MSALRHEELPALSVIGCGYLGVTHAACMAELGFEVIGIDVNPHQVEQLRDGRLPFFEPGLDDLLECNLRNGRLSFTTDVSAASRATVHFLTVGTPQAPDSDKADLSQLHQALDALRPHLRPGSVVVGKSTVPVGTAAAIATELGHDVDVVWNPEFLREGRAVADSLAPDRIVLGVCSARSEQIMRTVYAKLLDAGTPMMTMDLASAELVKASANAFLALKISFINSIAELCEVTGADVTSVAAALRHDERIGTQFLSPGLGYGGGCLPKDSRAYATRSRELGVTSLPALLEVADRVNRGRRHRIVELVEQACDGDINGCHVAALGAAFKPNSDDIRDSPALAVVTELAAKGAKVRVYDPQAMARVRIAVPEVDCANNIDEALAGADVVVLLTEWLEFRTLRPADAIRLVKRRAIVDGRDVLDRDSWQAASWVFYAPGRPRSTDTLRTSQPDRGSEWTKGLASTVDTR
ncbi:UDP-glucose dehydrogenase family protein [Amycolatopsis sp. NPDC049868]|uniref:UDP-glucose dehydrogenase family protein n=1 Tax=Amycolatopsis sp. NPDC049868 TaxID=3363934 RepID=UPI0037BBE75D